MAGTKPKEALRLKRRAARRLRIRQLAGQGKQGGAVAKPASTPPESNPDA